jgi:hypothetical protein
MKVAPLGMFGILGKSHFASLHCPARNWRKEALSSKLMMKHVFGFGIRRDELDATLFLGMGWIYFLFG